jgi:hypothetical protein
MHVGQVETRGSLNEAGAKFSGLEDLKSVKTDPAQIIIAFNVECLRNKGRTYGQVVPSNREKRANCTASRQS